MDPEPTTEGGEGTTPAEETATEEESTM